MYQFDNHGVYSIYPKSGQPWVPRHGPGFDTLSDQRSTPNNRGASPLSRLQALHARDEMSIFLIGFLYLLQEPRPCTQPPAPRIVIPRICTPHCVQSASALPPLFTLPNLSRTVSYFAKPCENVGLLGKSFGAARGHETPARAPESAGKFQPQRLRLHPKLGGESRQDAIGDIKVLSWPQDIRVHVQNWLGLNFTVPLDPQMRALPRNCVLVSSGEP